jgi:hypothetical protein
MIRLLFTPLIVLWLLFISLIGLVHAHPYGQNAEFQDFFDQLEACVTPCFMGIQPGVTTISDAANRLESRGWNQITESYNTVLPFYIYFQWTGGADRLIDTDSLIGLYLKNGIIETINVPMRISLGDIWAAKGQADWAFGAGFSDFHGVHHAIGYQEAGQVFLFIAPYRVPGKLRRLLHAPITLSLTVDLPPAVYPHPSLRGILEGQARMLGIED